MKYKLFWKGLLFSLVCFCISDTFAQSATNIVQKIGSNDLLTFEEDSDATLWVYYAANGDQNNAKVIDAIYEGQERIWYVYPDATKGVLDFIDSTVVKIDLNGYQYTSQLHIDVSGSTSLTMGLVKDPNGGNSPGYIRIGDIDLRDGVECIDANMGNLTAPQYSNPKNPYIYIALMPYIDANTNDIMLDIRQSGFTGNVYKNIPACSVDSADSPFCFDPNCK